MSRRVDSRPQQLVTALWNNGRGLAVSAPYNEDCESFFHMKLEDEPPVFRATQKVLASTEWLKLHPKLELQFTTLDVDIMIHVADRGDLFPVVYADSLQVIDHDDTYAVGRTHSSTNSGSCLESASRTRRSSAHSTLSVSSSTTVHRRHETDVPFTFEDKAFIHRPNQHGHHVLPRHREEAEDTTPSSVPTKYCLFQVSQATDEHTLKYHLGELEKILTFFLTWQRIVCSDESILVSDIVQMSGLCVPNALDLGTRIKQIIASNALALPLLHDLLLDGRFGTYSQSNDYVIELAESLRRLRADTVIREQVLKTQMDNTQAQMKHDQELKRIKLEMLIEEHEERLQRMKEQPVDVHLIQQEAMFWKQHGREDVVRELETMKTARC